jgi:hypothetical protein
MWYTSEYLCGTTSGPLFEYPIQHHLFYIFLHPLTDGICLSQGDKCERKTYRGVLQKLQCHMSAVD